MEVVGPAAAVAQLVGNVAGLIFKIKRAADTAKQNKRECENLVDYLSTIEEVLPTLPEDPEVARPLAKLGSTLQEAHDLVVACQKRGSFSKLFRASCLADRFREVNARITCDLSLFPLVIYTAIARRLDRMAQNDDSGTMAPEGAGSSKGKSSAGTVAVETQTQTQMVVSHVMSSAGSDDDNPRKLTWPEIAASTSNLAVVLGGGRSGTVYKGSLLHGGRVREVAVKVLKKHGRQGMEVSFVAELEILFPLRHDHIARLVGWCEEAEEERRVFVYDHMSNGTLRDHLLGSGGSPVASSWSGRVEVLLGAARALEHLHHRRATTLPAVIHRNVSSSNILLDARWRPHLSDFGQALLQAACEEPGGQGQLVPEAIGTFGYLDPEYYSTRRVSPAIDVYSFGVVTLEVLTGRPHVVVSSKQGEAVVPVAMVTSVLPVIRNGNLRDVLDARPSLVPTPGQLKALELVANTAMLCLWPQGKDRPAISTVVANLEKALGIIRSDDETNLLLSY